MNAEASDLSVGLSALKQGQTAMAVSHFREYLKLTPRDADGQHLLANALGRLGQNDEARTLVERAIKVDGRRAAFHNTLGNILKAQGDRRAALRAYARALELEPKMIGARFNQALIHQDEGRWGDAADALDDVLTHAPGHFEALSQRGVVAWRRGDASAAQRHFEAAIRVRPDAARMHNFLGMVLLHDGRYDRARDAFERAHALLPEMVGAQLNLAKARRAQGDFEGAADVLTEALEDRPEHAGLLCELGGVCRAQGKLDVAKQHYLAALTVDPTPITVAALAELYLLQGQPERAASLIRPHRFDSAPQVAVVRARLALRAGENEPDTTGVLHWLQPANARRAAADVRRQLHFCAGDLLHKRRQHNDAFEHYQEANALSAGQFDAEAHTRFVSQIIDSFGTGCFDSLAHTNAADVGPVFVVGMPRSGTAQVERMLGMHPHIESQREPVDMNLWPQRLALGEVWKEPVRALTTGQLNALVRDYMQTRRCPPTATWISDKMPLSFFYLGLIAMVFPKARVVHCRRDPMAIALSCYRQDCQDRALSFTRDLTALGCYIADYERLMAHWYKVLPLKIYDVEHTALVDAPKTQLRTLLDQFGLPLDPACLNQRRSVRDASTAADYASQLEPFTLALTRARARFSSEIT